MIEWLEHGELAITFDLDDGPKRIEVRRPKFGQHGYLMEAMIRYEAEEAAAADKIKADKKLSDADKTQRAIRTRGMSWMRWWELVMVGDAECAGLAREKPPPIEDYPLDLMVIANVNKVAAHWLLPLAPGEGISPTPNVTLPPDAPSPEPPST